MEEKDFKSLVLEKAKEIFIIYGYKKTTMEDIAKACNKSKGLIYHHYESKEQIFRILVNKEISEMLSKINANLDSLKSVKDKFIFLFTFSNEWTKDTTNLYHKIILEVFDYMDLIKDIVLKFHDDVIEIIKKILTEGEKTVFKIKDIDLTAATVLQMMMGFMYIPFTKLFNINIERNIDIKNYVNIIFNGLKNG